MIRPRHSNRSMLVTLIGASLVLVTGCGNDDERLLELSRESLRRQAEQNEQMSRQSQEVVEASRELVAADAEARREMTERALEKARLAERTVTSVTLRDTRSRWGSCTPDGAISLSWRLVLAPLPVLDYVVAHEVAHLAHMNHGPRFWALTAKLTDQVTGPQRWLKDNGARLLRYG